MPLQGGRNFRDLGGYPTVDGRRVKWGRLFRSGTMAFLTDSDYDFLSNLGIAAVCDLRSTGEREAEPTQWRTDPPAEYVAIYAKDRAETVGDVYLGLTVGCATCHDHKFDPIAQREFYALTAFWGNTTQYVMDGNSVTDSLVTDNTGVQYVITNSTSNVQDEDMTGVHIEEQPHPLQDPQVAVIVPILQLVVDSFI